MQQSGHLVDERASAAGAGAVHALLDAVVEVDDLGVLAAQLDGDIGGRDKGLDGTLAAEQHVGVPVLLVEGEDLVVEHGELNGGGTHVDAQVQVATSVLGVEDRAFGGVGGGDGYGLSGGGGLASDGRLPCRVLGLACGSDHTVFNALDEFAHCLSS